MNKEIKHLLLISVTLFLISIFIFNIYTYHATNFVPQASKASQIINRTRLRSPNINRPSEKWTYPNVNNSHIELIALKKPQQVLVINSNSHRVIYIVHAQINLPAQKSPLHILHARGQQIYHINGSRQAVSKNWLGISNGNYIETPVTDMNSHHVSHNLRKVPRVENTIQVSHADAKWLQALPENTPLLVKEGY